MATSFTSKDLIVDFHQGSGDTPDHYIIEYTCGTGAVTHRINQADFQSEDGDGIRHYVDTLTYSENEANGLTRTPVVRMWAVDALGVATASLSEQASNGHPVLLGTPTIKPTLDGVIVYLLKPTDADFVGFRAYVGDSSSFTMDDSHLVYDGSATTFTVPLNDDNQHYLRIVPYDAFGFDTSTASSPIAISRTSLDDLAPEDGKDGNDAVVASLSSDSVTVWAYANGVVANYGPATTTMTVVSGTAQVTGKFNYSVSANPENLTYVLNSNVLIVQGGFAETYNAATITLQATGTGTFNGVVLTKVFTLTKTTGGYQIVDSLPTADNFEGRTVYNEADGKLYTFTKGAWKTGVAADDIAGEIDAAKLDADFVNTVHANTSDIVDLLNTYGSTADAATSATQAAASKTAAQNYAQASEDAKDAAEAAEALASASKTAAGTSASAAAASKTGADTAASNADAAKTLAQTAATNAKTSETNAASSAGAASTSAGQASTSATNAGISEGKAGTYATTASNAATTATNQAASATSSATTATTKASDAATSAQTATTQAGIATTKAGDAQTYANNSATSATGAAGSATTATTQAGVAATAAGNATLVAANLLPDSLNANGDFFYDTTSGTGYVGDPAAKAMSAAGKAKVAAVTGVGYAYTLAPSSSDIVSQVGVFHATTGKIYELSVEYEVVTFVAASTLGFWAICQTSAYAQNSSNINTTAAISATGVFTKTIRIAAAAASGISAWPANTAYLRFSVGSNASPYMNGNTVRVRHMSVKDVTALVAAETQASAAATSAATATTQATAAGTSATTATTQAGIATTKAGDAQTYANNAATSATGAAGSATSATTQAGVAANSAAAASKSAAATIPSTFENSGEFFDFEGLPASGVTWSTTDGGPTAGTGTSTNYVLLRTKTGLPIVPGRRYRATAKVRNGTSDTTHRPFVRLAGFDSSNARTAYTSTYSTGGTSWETIVAEINASATASTIVTVKAEVALGYPAGVAINAQCCQLLLEDITASYNADASAAAAATSASTAATKATDAGTSASAAASSATTATTQAGNAQTSANAASTSATNAAGSANTATTQAGLAATSATGAALAVAKMFPNDFSANTNWTVASGMGDPAAMTPCPTTDFRSVTGVGNVYFHTTNPGFFGPRAQATTANRRYRATVTIRVLSGTISGYLTYNKTDNTGALTNNRGVVASGDTDIMTSLTSSSGWVTLRSDYVWGATIVAMRPTLYFNAWTSAEVEVSSFLVEDVTDSYNAAASASAAASSATTATTQATAAGTSATAASSSALTASTAMGAAQQMTSGNLIGQPSLTSNSVGLWAGAAVVAGDSPASPSRTYVLSNTSFNMYYGSEYPGNFNGRTFKFTGWVKMPSGGGGIGFGFYGTKAGSPTSSYTSLAGAVADTWTQLTGIWTVPAGTFDTARPFVRSNSPFGVLWTDLVIEDITERTNAANLVTGMFPDRIQVADDAYNFITSASVQGAPSTAARLDPTQIVNAAGYGLVYQGKTITATNTSVDFAPRALLPATAGKIYKVEAEAQCNVFASGDVPQLSLQLRKFDANYANNAGVTYANQNVADAATVYKVVGYFSDTAIAAANGQPAVVAWGNDAASMPAVWLRPYIRHQRASGSVEGSQVQFRRITVTDVTSSYAAAASASVATTQAANATNSAASASTSATVAANVAQASINANPVFANWSGTFPDSWANWAGTPAKVAGLNSPNGAQFTTVGTSEAGMVLNYTAANSMVGVYPGYYVVECDFKLVAGDLAASGLLLDAVDPDSTSYTRTTITFATEVGASVVGKTYRMRKLVNLTRATMDRLRIYLMASYSAITGTRTDKQIIFYRCAIRAASDAEIKTGQIDTLSASVTTQAGAITTLQGKTSAYWQTVLGAGTSNAVIAAKADGSAGSTVSLAANKIQLANTDGSAYYDALVIENGNATLAGKLRAGAVTAQNMAVTNKGLNLDPTFAGGATMWGPGWSSRAQATSANGWPCTYGTFFTAQDNGWNGRITCKPGEQYKISGWTWVDAGNTNTGGVGFAFYWYDTTGVNISAGVAVSNATPGWLYQTATVTVPPGAAAFTYGFWADRITSDGSPAIVGNTLCGDMDLEKLADASLIVDGTISARKLLVGTVTDNLVVNPRGADSTTLGWTAGVEQSTSGVLTDFHSGYGWFTPGQSGFWLAKNSTANGTSAWTRQFPVVPGRTYSVRLQAGGSATTSGGLYIRMLYAAAKASTDYSGRDGYTDMVGSGPIINGYQWYELTWTCPAGMYWASLAIYNWVGGPTSLYFSEVEVTEQTGVTKIANGAVTTDKLQVGAVTAAKIAVTQLSSITATIGTLQTATSGARTVIQDNLITVYNSSNVAVVRLGLW